MGKKRSKVLILALAALTFAAPIVNAQTPDRTIILADTVKLTRWADIHQVPDPAHNDPYYHLEVFEHKKGAKPWVFKRLAHHMVITPTHSIRVALRSKPKPMPIRTWSFGSRTSIGATIQKVAPRHLFVRQQSLTACETNLSYS
ncbi:hypothetical protein AB664_27810 [Brucella anthropi]|uniref:DUF5086 domain-containing protein n=1 Tax=Brucella anthropi TaxID=529 RepID=A0A656Z5U7_BRUAN|nr:hypothetical protein AB664_27810 [Brucella anthropi]